MKRIVFLASFVGVLFLLAGASYFFLAHATKAGVVITNVRTENIIGAGAQILWDTDTPSDSRVAYGSGASLSLFSNSRCDAGGYVVNHCVNLTGLTANTAYYYKVESMNTANIDSQLGGFQFTSAATIINDPTLPAAPSSLSVSLNPAGTDATFSWADNSSNETEFKVFRRLLGDTAWTYFMSAGTNVASFLYPGIPYGTYEYVVSACNGGCSANSNSVSVTRSFATDTTLPSVPQNVSAEAVSSSQINLSWTASTDNVSVSGYNVYRNSAFLANVASPSYSDTALSPSTLYFYTVAAADGTGNLSPGSQIVGATTKSDTLTAGGTAGDDITPPVISSLAAQNIIGAGAQIIWTTDDPSTSVAHYGTASGLYPLTSTWRCDAGGNVTNHCINLTGLTSGTRYYYQAVSMNSAGYETKSAGEAFSATSSTEIISGTATATETILAPITVSAKAGNPYCLSGFTVGGVSFFSSPAFSGYFILSGGRLSSPQEFSDGTGNVMPYGNYTWKAFPKKGYFISGSASGTFSIPSLDSCLSVVNTTTIPTTATAITVPIAEENPHAYIALWQGDTHIAAGQAIAGKIRINIGVEDADGVFVYLKTRSMTEPKLLGTAVRATDRPFLWRFSWDSATVADEEAIIFSRVKNTAGEYRGDSIFINIKNNIQIPPPIVIAPPIVVGSTPPAGNSIIPQPHSNVPAIAENEQPKKYREVEDLLRQKYKEAETLFRKENKLSAGKETNGEEKQKIAEKIHEQFPALAASENSILLGTTTLSRTEESAFVAANITRIMTERNETLVLADTDDDGISDYDETRIYGTNGAVADTDGDGVKDGNEILVGANPREKVFVPIPRENPKENIQGIIPASQILSVLKVEQVSVAEDSNNPNIASPRVLIHGTGPKNSFVTLYIFSTPVVVTVKTDSDGKWTYTMDKELENGNHEIYVAMTESAGKIIVKSDAIPFVKTAQAATLSSDFALANTETPESPSGFFRGGTLALSLVILFVILGLSFMIISFVSRKKESSGDSNV